MEEKKGMSELEAQELLAQVLNDTPTEIEIAGKKHHITALKLGTQNLIAAESVRIQKAQEGNMLDLYRQFAQSIPAVIRCIAYAVLNDKSRIFKNYATKEHSDEFVALCEQLEWESDKGKFMQVLIEVMNKINLDFFFQISTMLTMMRDSALATRKKKTALT